MLSLVAAKGRAGQSVVQFLLSFLCGLGVYPPLFRRALCGQNPFVPSWPILSFARYLSTLIYPQSGSQKNCSKPLKTRLFLTKRCKKTLTFDKKTQKTSIFTLIFSLKTNKSYKITLLTTANRPIFQNFSQKPLFFDFLSFFLPMWLKFLPPFMRPKLTTNPHFSQALILGGFL